MAFSITTNYAGKDANVWRASAILSAKSLDYLSVLSNIKKSTPLKKMGIPTGAIQTEDCDFSASGNITLTERTLTPYDFKVNVEVCKSDLETHWEADKMRPGAKADVPADFLAFFEMKMKEQIAKEIDEAIWKGNTTNTGASQYLKSFNGFEKLLADDSDVIDVTGTTLSASNILTEIGKVYDAIPSSIIDKEDLKIFIPKSAYQYFLRAMITSTGNANFNVNDKGALSYIGIELVPVNMSNNKMIAAQTSNLFFGTDLQSDLGSIDIVDMAVVAEKNLRFRMDFSAGVEYAYGAEIVLYS